MAKTVLQKEWYDIQAPDMFDSVSLAETPAEDAGLLHNRTVKKNLKDLVPTSDKYYMDVFFQVVDVEGSTAHTQLVGHDTAKEYTSRMVQRGSNRIDWVEDLTTKDGKTVRVKVIATTIRKTKTAKVGAVRERIAEVVRDEAENHTYQQFMERIFDSEVQNKAKDAASELYPLRDLEVRKTELQRN